MTSHWLDAARSALAEASVPVPFFVRDDDGGWDQPALDQLLGLARDFGIVVDVAVIPEAVDDRCAEALRSWISAGTAAVHQHGWMHRNRAVEGRKCEFGPERPTKELRDDLAAGQERMTALFGDDAQPIFTPPWNRCGRTTADTLRELGFEVLSRESGAEPFGIAGLAEIPVSFDWFAKRRGVPLERNARGEHLADAIRNGQSVGLMLHHAVTDAGERLEVAAVFDLITSSPNARVTTIWDLARSRQSLDCASD